MYLNIYNFDFVEDQSNSLKLYIQNLKTFT